MISSKAEYIIQDKTALIKGYEKDLGLTECLPVKLNPRNGLLVARVHYSVNPTWTEERVAKEKGGMSKQRWDRDMELKYHSLGGRLIFECFDKAVHVVPPFEIPKGWFKFRYLDYGRRNPTCNLWIAVDFEGTHYVYREWYHPTAEDMRRNAAAHVPRYTLKQHAFFIRALSGEILNGGKSAERYVSSLIDPQAGEENFGNSDDKKTVIDRLADNGLVCEKASKASDGLDVIEEMLRKRKLYFMDGRCENTLAEIEDYRWEDFTEATQQRRNLKEAPLKSADHAMNCLKFMGNYPIKQAIRGVMPQPAEWVRQDIPDSQRASRDIKRSWKRRRYGVR